MKEEQSPLSIVNSSNRTRALRNSEKQESGRLWGLVVSYVVKAGLIY